MPETTERENSAARIDCNLGNDPRFLDGNESEVDFEQMYGVDLAPRVTACTEPYRVLPTPSESGQRLEKFLEAVVDKLMAALQTGDRSELKQVVGAVIKVARDSY